MKQLTECELVNVNKKGKWSYYSINNTTFQEYIKYINSISTDKKDIKTSCKCD